MPSFATVLLLAALLLASTAGDLRAQQADRELRGVWLTTLSGLDWPPPSSHGNPVAQQASLRGILDNIASLGLNAVFLQVRSRGNAFYRSSYEPWAAELTGTLGADPGWDPLAFAIEECRARGLEIHAWVNVYKVWSGGTLPPRRATLHVAHAHPEWVRQYRDEYWIDPGIPDARSYLVRVMEDLVRRYDVDGLHLDYCRYPDADFSDERTYAQYGRGTSKAAWRRANVDAAVREIYAAVTAARPAIHVGAAPIGIYENLPTARGWQGLHALSQDSRAWLRDGVLDYVAPQMYWGLKSRGSSIDFEALVSDWVANSAGRHVYAGLAPYKPEVFAHLDEQIAACRARRAAGEIFFRYAHIADGGALRTAYPTPAVAPALPWRDRIRPNPPRRLLLQRGNGGAQLAWLSAVPAPDGDDASRYVVMRLAPYGGAGRILAILPATRTSFVDPDAGPETQYAVSALDRFRNESDALSTTALASNFLPAPAIPLPAGSVSQVTDAGEGLLLVGYTVESRSRVRVSLLDERGAEAGALVDGIQDPGTYVVGIERGALGERIRTCLVECGNLGALRPLPAAADAE